MFNSRDFSSSILSWKESEGAILGSSRFILFILLCDVLSITAPVYNDRSLMVGNQIDNL